MGKMQFRSLGREDPLEKGMATHSSIVAWEISWTEKPGQLQSMGSQRVRQDCVTEHTCMLFTSDLRRLGVWNTARWKRLEDEWMVQMWSRPLEGCLPVKAEKTGERDQ